jgi:hypothetical protein
MDNILTYRRIIYRYRDNNKRWRYVDGTVYLAPDVEPEYWLKHHGLSEDAEVLFISPPREEYSGGHWGTVFPVTRGEVKHLIGG